MDDKRRLDDAKRRFLASKQEIQELRDRIAQAQRPLRVGQRITIRDNGREYDCVVGHVGSVLAKGETFDPVVGAGPVWVVSGRRVRKSDGAAVVDGGLPAPGRPSTARALRSRGTRQPARLVDSADHCSN